MPNSKIPQSKESITHSLGKSSKYFTPERNTDAPKRPRSQLEPDSPPDSTLIATIKKTIEETVSSEFEIGINKLQETVSNLTSKINCLELSLEKSKT